MAENDNQRDKGRGGRDNPGGGKGGGAKVECGMCKKQTTQAPCCSQCGSPLQVTCPECKVLVRNTKRCADCGADLHPNKEKSPAKPKPPVYDLSVTLSGKAGVYTLAIQVTKDGFPAPNQSVLIWDGQKHVLDTNAEGFISHGVNLTCNSVVATVKVVGTNQDWAGKLVGASFKPAGGFLQSLFDAIRYYRGQ